MREIKFRAWSKISNEMFEVEEINLPSMNYSTENEIGILMQFTGLKDKNRRFYCEGDIIRYTDNNGIDRIILFESIEDLFFHPEWEFILSKHSKIIGNKHENPELLGEVK